MEFPDHRSPVSSIIELLLALSQFRSRCLRGTIPTAATNGSSTHVLLTAPHLQHLTMKKVVAQPVGNLPIATLLRCGNPQSPPSRDQKNGSESLRGVLLPLNWCQGLNSGLTVLGRSFKYWKTLKTSTPMVMGSIVFSPPRKVGTRYATLKYQSVCSLNILGCRKEVIHDTF